MENPRARKVCNYQERFSVNVWAGIVADVLVGPVFLPARLNGELYIHFLQEILPPLLEEVPLTVRQRMWFQHDGCPAYFTRIVREFLNNTFPERWIGRGGPIAWPPRSPDLTCLDFFLWGHLGTLVYATPVNDEEQLRNRILIAADTIRTSSGIFERIRRSMVRRSELCLQVNGGHFEQFL